MIRVDNMSLVSSYTKQMTMKFDFSYDNGTPLPINTYTMGTTIYRIANGSTATNLKDNRTYVYNDGKWNINHSTSSVSKTSKISNITNNGNYSIVNNDTLGMNNIKVDVAGGSTPTPSVGSRSDVNFYDYDGTIVNSYTKDAFLALSTIPENPTHEGLTAQGWNWDFEEAKQYVTEHGKLEIGQTYITDDGKTRLYITLTDGRLKPYLGLTGNSAGTTVTIDWGDGSDVESVTLNAATVYTPHEYVSGGDYIISINVDNGTISFEGSMYRITLFKKSPSSSDTNGDAVYANTLKKVEIGKDVTSIGGYAFYCCYSLISVTIPSSVTSIGGGAFYCCYSLTSITIPDLITSIENSVFSNCYSITSVTIPSSVTTIGANTFYCCYSLTSITIPDSVTSIQTYAFYDCYSLTSATIPSSVILGEGVFRGCRSLTSITIPPSVTFNGKQVFLNCTSLVLVIIQLGVTAIGQSAFDSCYSLSSITIPSSVTSIGNSAFTYCYGLGVIKFSSTTPPTVANSSAWSNVPTDCKILVPTGSLSAYKSASNYPSPSTYTYEEYTPE